MYITLKGAARCTPSYNINLPIYQDRSKRIDSSFQWIYIFNNAKSDLNAYC